VHEPAAVSGHQELGEACPDHQHDHHNHLAPDHYDHVPSDHDDTTRRADYDHPSFDNRDDCARTAADLRL
jgi:hypothetical protein